MIKEAQKVDDIQLVARAQTGDTAAFGDLYERYLDAIYHYVFYRVDSREDAEDVTESIFLRAWQALESNPPREVPFRLWLYRIAHNAVVDYYRMRKEQVGLEVAEQLPDPVVGPEAWVTQQERASLLKGVMAQLKEEHQQVLTCRFIVGLSHIETAIIMERNEGAVRALQFRAIEAMRNILIAQGDTNV